MLKPTFNFINYIQPVEIAGKKFKIDCGSRTGDYIKYMADETRELVSGFSDGDVDENAIIAHETEIIDHILGEGATDQIFEGKEPGLNEVMDIVSFITVTVGQFALTRMELIQNMVKNP